MTTVGPALSPWLVLAAYQQGYFPMPDADTGEMLWYHPDPRAVIPLDQFHVSKSLRKSLRQGDFKISIDRDFVSVMAGCASRDPTWINDEIRDVYTALHRLGAAHSVEVWSQDQELVGGVYGVSQRGVFNAESMFSRVTDGSKIALWALVQHMKNLGLTLLEVQFMTEHLKSLGAENVSKARYLAMLEEALAKTEVSFVGIFEPVGARYLLEGGFFNDL